MFEDPESKTHHFARKWFLAYNMVTSMLWPIEILLTEIQQAFETQNPDHQPLRVKLFMELMIAVYFVIDAAVDLSKKIKGQDPTDEMAVDSVVNLFAYSYVLWSNYKSRNDFRNDFSEIGEAN